LTAVSNSVTITVSCEEGRSGAPEEEGEGGGGGASGVSGRVEACVSNWVCDPWIDCNEDGLQSRKCIDTEACNADFIIHWVHRECTYIGPVPCQEVWECSEWDDCSPDNIQNRTCSEANNCDTELDKPLNIQQCSYITTCDDNIQNQGETGVDCGGPCLPCKTIEVPGVIEEEAVVSTAVVVLTLTALSILLVYNYFHREINTSTAKLLLGLVKRRKKRIFLSNESATLFVNDISEIGKITTKNIKAKSLQISSIGRDYFSEVFKIPSIFDEIELVEKINKLRIKEPLNDIFHSFYKKIVSLETKKGRISKTDLLMFTEELRALIHLTSKAKPKGDIKELKIKKSDSKNTVLKKHIFNSYLAMQFDQIKICKEKYSKIINLYESFSEHDKGLFYDDIQRLFKELKYSISILSEE
jgi:hypothetical protein